MDPAEHRTECVRRSHRKQLAHTEVLIDAARRDH
jgi:hypothetical protein